MYSHQRKIYADMVRAFDPSAYPPIYFGRQDDEPCIKAPSYRLYSKDGTFINEYDTKNEVPEIDIHTWAKENGIKISEDRKTLTCYKAVRKTKKGYYESFYDENFRYKIGEYASAPLFDSNHLNECSSGLHGSSLKVADDFASTRKMAGEDVAYLELKVDISNPDEYVIPYSVTNAWCREGCDHFIRESNKIRFKKCFVVREVRFKIVAKDIDTLEEYDW